MGHNSKLQTQCFVLISLVESRRHLFALLCSILHPVSTATHPSESTKREHFERESADLSPIEMMVSLPNLFDIQKVSASGMETNVMRAEFRLEYFATVPSQNGDPPDALRSDSLQSELVDGAISQISCNLPTEVMRVTSLQRQQSSQITVLQKELQHLQEKKKQALEQTNEIKEEIERVRRQTYLVEESNAKIVKRCIQHKNEIVSLVKDCDDKQSQLSIQRLELHTMKSKLMQYRQKLDDYISIVNATAASATVQAEIEQAEERLARLKEKKEYTEQNPEETEKICGGSLERDLKEKIAELNSQSDQLVEDVKELQKKIDSIRSKQEQAKQATSVLQKRNVAQVLCLKRQVKQQQLRHRQWVEQSRMMQQNVNALKEKLKSL